MLKNLLENIDYQLIQGNLELEITQIDYHSQNVVQNSLFVCLSGFRVDGHDYIPQAIDLGAKAIMIEKEVPYQPGITYIKVANTRYALAMISCAFFHHPSRQMTVIGITGTKGKTTVSYMIAAILKAAHIKTGIIGTTGTYIQDQYYQTQNTTPESYELQKIMRQMVNAGCTHCIMEVSSQGLMLERVVGIDFDYGIFTNLSPDHIGKGEHASFEDYLACKKKLFQMCRIGIFNQDDAFFPQMSQQATCQIKTYSLQQESDLQAFHLQPFIEEQKLGIMYQIKGMLKGTFRIFMPGTFNVYNALSATLLAQCLKIDFVNIHKGLQVVHIPGRLEIVPTPLPCIVMIDYAHNAYAYQNLFMMLKDYHPTQIICVFGAGGHRDRHRRFEVGEVVAKNHAFAVVTADNPRGEKVSDICQDIVAGIEKYHGAYVVIEDRRKAIHYALDHAVQGSMILCLGKGHENYQIIDKEPLPFSEREIIDEYFQ